ncbi:CBS domain-containing protein [soil metagenome]
MEIGSLVQRDILTVGPGLSIGEAARRMTARNVGSAIVMMDDGHPGIITERDLLRAMAEKADPDDTPVESYMTANAITASPSWGVLQAAEKMSEGGFRRLLVYDDQGGIDGILSIRDLMDAMLEEANKREARGMEQR